MAEPSRSSVKTPNTRRLIAQHYYKLSPVDPKRHAWWIILLIVGLVVLLAGPNDTEIFGKVVGVGDGNNLVLIDDSGVQRHIRLAYVEAPELSQSLGQQSKKWLADRLLQRDVRVEIRGQDEKSRILGRVWVYDFEINHEILRAGMAFHIKREDSGQPSDEFVISQRAESEAREHHTGVWHQDFPQAPWNYREEATPPLLRENAAKRY